MQAESNVVYVAFGRGEGQHPDRCATCPVRACCTCMHWLNEGQRCAAGSCLADHRLPSTQPVDWCGEWKPRPLALVR